jgi:hypothetical protein
MIELRCHTSLIATTNSIEWSVVFWKVLVVEAKGFLLCVENNKKSVFWVSKYN